MKYILVFLIVGMFLLSFASAEIKQINIVGDGNYRVTTIWGIDTIFFNLMKDRVSIYRDYVSRNSCTEQIVCEKIKKLDVCHNVKTCSKLTDAQVESLILSKVESKTNITLPVKKTKQNLLIKLWELIKK